MVMTKARQRADFNPEYYSGENLLINAAFDENQREADGVWSTTGYAWDRFIVSGSDVAGGTVTLATGKDSQGKYAKFTTLGATSAAYIQQRIEENLKLQGQALTFSSLVAHTLPVVGAQITLEWFTTEGVSASSKETVTFDSAANASIIEQVIDCPIITAYSPDNEYYLELTYWFGGDEVTPCPDGTYQFHWMKLEVGDEATAFVADSAATNLAKCHRYHAKFQSKSQSSISWSSGHCLLEVRLPEVMRSIPYLEVSGFSRLLVGGTLDNPNFVSTGGSIGIRVDAFTITTDIFNNHSAQIHLDGIVIADAEL